MPRRKNKKGAKNQITNNAKSPNDAADTNAETKLTPYQGPFQAFGMFKCQKCSRYWTSNVSWANYGQMCNKCKINVFPFRQFPLDSDDSKKFNKSDPVKHHPQEYCGKCQALGRFCGKKLRGPRRRPSADAD